MAQMLLNPKPVHADTRSSLRKLEGHRNGGAVKRKETRLGVSESNTGFYLAHVHYRVL